jgi:hypothetical protein
MVTCFLSPLSNLTQGVPAVKVDSLETFSGTSGESEGGLYFLHLNTSLRFLTATVTATPADVGGHQHIRVDPKRSIRARSGRWYDGVDERKRICKPLVVGSSPTIGSK